MKFQVDRDVLNEAVSSTARTLPKRPAVPVLAGVWITASQGVVDLFAFDYEMSVRTRFEADVETDGEVLVSGSMLGSITSRLPKKPVTVGLEDGKVRISCDTIKYELLTMALDEYPEPPRYPSAIGKVDGSELKRAIDQVAVAASRDDAVPLLATTRIEMRGSSMTLMATDRYRLAVREIEWQPNDSNVETAALIKSRKLIDAGKSLRDHEVELSLDLDSGASAVLGIETNGEKMTTQLTDGDYPPVLSLFPPEMTITALVRREELLKALDRVSLVVQNSSQIRMNFSPESLVVSAGQGDDAQAAEELHCRFVGEQSMLVAFNPVFLSDGLKALSTEYARLAFTHPSKPAVITGQDQPDGEAQTDYRYLLMPIRNPGQ